MRSTDHQKSLRFTPLNLSRSNSDFASVSLSNQPYKLLPWKCIFKTSIRHASVLFVDPSADWFSYQPAGHSRTCRSSFMSSIAPAWVGTSKSTERIYSSASVRPPRAVKPSDKDGDSYFSWSAGPVLEMCTTRTGPVPDNTKDIRSPNPQESEHNPTPSPFSISCHLRFALVNSATRP